MNADPPTTEAQLPPMRPDIYTVIAAALEVVCSDGNSDARSVAADVVRRLEAEGYAIGIRHAPGELMPHEKAEAALDRHRARMGRMGYERHPEFGKGLQHG